MAEGDGERWRRALAEAPFAAVAAEIRRLPAAARQQATRELLSAAAALLAVPGDAAARSPRPRVELELLGSGAVRVGGLRRTWPLRRALLVTAYLALAPDRRATKDELVEAVWPDAGSEAVRRNFHPTLSAARRVLLPVDEAAAPTIAYRHGTYRLAPAIEWRTDVEELVASLAEGERRAESGDPAGATVALRHGWRLYRGPLLAGHDLEWLAVPRERAREVYLRVLRRLGDLHVEQGDDEAATDAYRAHLVEDPLAEPVHAALMRLYARQGRRDLVRRQFVRLQEGLGELAVPPQDATLELYHRLMA